MTIEALSDVPSTGTADEFGAGRLIKHTASICPGCLGRIGAEVRERGGQVWMDKRCPDHGVFSALMASDARFYYEVPAKGISSGSCCGSACGDAQGDPMTNHSCTVLIEITERCNLSCPTCFAGSSPQHSRMLSLEEFIGQVDTLAAGGKGDADVIQLSGGEPTVHPDLFAMIEALLERGFRRVCINTNGIKLARPEFAERLAAYMGGDGVRISAYLQFDGFDEDTYAALRGRDDLLDIKLRALDNCGRHGIHVTPVMTLTRDINQHEVGDFLALAADRDFVRNVVIQPAMYSGRYDNPRRVDRLTLAETSGLVCNQFGVFEADDFMPIPCSDPNCFGMAVALRTAQGLAPVSRYFPRFETWGNDASRDLIERFTDTINGPQAVAAALDWAASDAQLGTLDDEEVDRLLDAMIGWQKGGDVDDIWDALFIVGIKPFMDAWTYDQERIDRCCVHVLDPEGKPVSFCEYNAIIRPRLASAPIALVNA